jgi:2-hydroxy-3-keto-5-methylthiopentenyl-1-phosphate phosphatase
MQPQLLKERPMKYMAFCDFDGTIIEEDTLVEIFQHYLEQSWQTIRQELYEGRMSLRQAIPQMLEELPAERFEEVLDFCGSMTIRKGFGDFLEYMQKLGVPVVVLSGGMRAVIERNLTPYLGRIHSVFAAEVWVRNGQVRVESKHEAGEELMAKAQVMAQFKAECSIAVGDGLTDLSMAQSAQMIFARDYLAEQLEKDRHPFTPYNDFYDIINCLSSQGFNGNQSG